MNSRQKEYVGLFAIVIFYILTGYLGIYGISQSLLWPVFAIPMSLFLIKTGQKEILALAGVILSVVISFITTSTFHPIVVTSFLVFVLLPAFVFGTLYNKKTQIPLIVINTTVACFFGAIVFLTFGKLLGIDYLGSYFTILDTVQSIWNEYLMGVDFQKILPGKQGKEILDLYIQMIAQVILIAKRTYPATLFTISLTTTIIHLLIIQLIAYIRSWRRPYMRDVLNVGLSPVAAWVLVGLWITVGQMGDVDTIWTFATESMINVLFVLFQIIGLITTLVMIMKIGTNKIVRIILSIISMLWLIFNPTLLVIIGCMDSMFNFRKVKTLI